MIKFELNNRADTAGTLFLGCGYRELDAVSPKDSSQLYYCSTVVVARLWTIPGVGNADKSNVKIFGMEASRWAQIKLIEAQEAPVSWALRQSLLYGFDGNPVSRFRFVNKPFRNCHGTMIVCGLGHMVSFCDNRLSICTSPSVVSRVWRDPHQSRMIIISQTAFERV